MDRRFLQVWKVTRIKNRLEIFEKNQEKYARSIGLCVAIVAARVALQHGAYHQCRNGWINEFPVLNAERAREICTRTIRENA